MIEIREATPDDHRAVVALAGAALGWREGDPNEELFRWKHLDNPLGTSHLWVAEDRGRLVGFRAFLRWSFDDPHLGAQRAVRAVDTATHPEHQGQGIFTALTRHGLDRARAEGVDFVFNTPNDQSRPGYLKMGWEVVGRVPVLVTVSSVRSLPRLARSRVPADKWSVPSDAGDAARDVLADSAAVAELVDSMVPASGLRTRRTVPFLQWRYGLDRLGYRAVLRSGRIEDGVALFRVRRRGATIETTLADVIVPAGDRRAEADLIDRVGAATRSDYLIQVGPRLISGRAVRLPGQGPLLTWRAVNRTSMPPLERWQLALGDLELF